MKYFPTIKFLAVASVLVLGITFISSLTPNKNPNTISNDVSSTTSSGEKMTNGQGVSSEVQGEKENDDDSDNKIPTSNVKTTVTPTATTKGGYTIAEVAKHRSSSDCWTVVNGSVYNLTSFVSNHPGGVSAISKLCGIDGTSQFENQHGGQRRPENELASLKIGELAK